MKTDDWIDVLSRNAGAAQPWPGARRMVAVLSLGGVAAVVLALTVIGPIPPAMFATPAPWLKLAYAALLIAAGVWCASRLARPSSDVRSPLLALVGVAALAAAVAAGSYAGAPPETRWFGLLGHSWRSCPWNVLGLSLPTLALLLWALRGLAPVRLRLAGFAAGLVAGAVGAFGYAFACLETAPAFIGAWYSLGVLLAGALGAALGPRVLRW